MRLILRNGTLGLSVVMGFVTLIFVVVLAYAAGDSGTTDDVTWSYWVGGLAYSGATEETDSRHSYYIRNNRDESIIVNPRNKGTIFRGNAILLQLWHIHQIYANASWSL